MFIGFLQSSFRWYPSYVGLSVLLLSVVYTKALASVSSVLVVGHVHSLLRNDLLCRPDRCLIIAFSSLLVIGHEHLGRWACMVRLDQLSGLQDLI